MWKVQQLKHHLASPPGYSLPQALVEAFVTGLELSSFAPVKLKEILSGGIIFFIIIIIFCKMITLYKRIKINQSLNFKWQIYKQINSRIKTQKGYSLLQPLTLNLPDSICGLYLFTMILYSLFTFHSKLYWQVASHSITPTLSTHITLQKFWS